MPRYDVRPRYAEQPTIQIWAKDDDEAQRKAEQLAKEDRASRGYLPGGSLCPARVPT